MDSTEQRAKRVAHEVAPWIDRLARLGYLAKGIVYCTVGLLAAQAAFGAGGQTTGSEGALAELPRQPFGQLLLAIVAIGLVGYTLWRLTQAVADPDHKGDDAKGLATRAGYVVSGLAYAGLALTALRLLMGTGGAGGDATQDWTARLMAWPLGPWLVGIAGLVVIGVGLGQFYDAYRAAFRDEMKRGEMSEAERTWADRVWRFGLAARGVTFCLIGGFLVVAALQSDPSEARGLGGALSTLAGQPYGPWLLGVVALGLVAYGVFQLVLSRYRRIDV